MHFGLFSNLEPKDLWGKKNKLRRRRWQSRGCAKLKQQASNPTQTASHSLHLRLLLLFLLLSSFSPSSLSSFRGDCCGFSPSPFGFVLNSFFLFYVSNSIGSRDLPWKNLEPLSYMWLGRIQSPSSYTWLGIGTRKLLIFEIGKMFQPLDL